jgi:hypothetical protein
MGVLLVLLDTFPSVTVLVSCCLHIGRMRQKTPNWVGSEEYDNGCLSGVLDEVLPLLLDDHNARQ